MNAKRTGMTPLQLLTAVEAAGVVVTRGGSYEDGRPWVDINSTTWLEVGRGGQFELYWVTHDTGPVNVLDDLLELPRLLPPRLRKQVAKHPTRAARRSTAQPQARPQTRPPAARAGTRRGAGPRSGAGTLHPKIVAALTAMAAIAGCPDALRDKKAIAGVVKLAVVLRDSGKRRRETDDHTQQ